MSQNNMDTDRLIAEFAVSVAESANRGADLDRSTAALRLCRDALKSAQWIQKQRGHEQYFYVCAACGREQESVKHRGHTETCCINNAVAAADAVLAKEEA